MNSTKQKRQKTGRRLKFTNDDLWGYIFIAAAMTDMSLSGYVFFIFSLFYFCFLCLIFLPVNFM